MVGDAGWGGVTLVEGPRDYRKEVGPDVKCLKPQ